MATAIAGAAACSSCIARGSRVRTPTGLRPIEDLVIGDEVLCLDPLGDQLVASRLTAIRSARRECVRLSYAGGSLTLTSDHPVYCPEAREWAPAGDWVLHKRSHLLLRAEESAQPVEVQEASSFAGIHEVFDLTVEHALHNFIAEGILVHNKQFPGPGTTCVARGSRVRTPKGLRAVEELAIGDEVLCLDPSTGTHAVAKLVGTRSSRRECLQIAFSGGNLTLTSDHPVYCPDTREWAPAGDWATGKRKRVLLSRDEDVAAVEIDDASVFAGVFEVFDLSVDHELHNFLAEGVLVHNKSPLPDSCLDADGGTVYEFNSCACPGGGEEGFIQCAAPDGGPVCIDCPDEVSDAGTSDAGSNDGGAFDGGSTDGGTTDGGASDGG